MFTKKLEDQFSADLLNTVRGVLDEAKKCSKDCKCEKCEKEEDEKDEMKEGKTGLWANIHAKRKRIKNGSGERMRKPGSKGAPTDADFKAASEEVDPDLEDEMKRTRQTKKSVADAKKKYGTKCEEVELEEKNLTGLPKSTAEKNQQYIEITHLLGHKRRVPVHPTNAYKAHNRYRNDPSTKSARIVSEDLEQIDELSKKTLGSYVKKAAGHVGAEALTAGLKIKDGENPMKNLNKALRRQKGIATATDKLTKEEQEFIDALNGADIEQIDELSVNTLDNYRTKARKEIIDAGANDDNRLYNKRVKGYRAASKAVSKKFAKEEVELEEGRGRPPKEGSAAWHAKQQKDNDDMVALGVQLRKAKSMNKKVRFMNGKEHEIHPHHADRFEDHMAARKTSQEKAAFQKQAHKSHEDFVKAVSAPVPKASKDTGEIVKYRH